MIVCFYGHKGGAGRSAAVANAAPALSSAGYRVLIVDFDLEAPGVHRFFGIPDEACRGGVVDLVEAHAARLAAGDTTLPAFPEEMLLEPRFSEVTTLDGELSAEQVRDKLLGPRTIGTTTRFETGVRILPAGRLDAGYRARVAEVDWKARWNDPAWRAFFGWFKLELEARAEVVFLDARAGVTELGALCLFALADRVVLLTPPTSQGLDGVLATARALRAARRGPADHGTLLVPSRVSKDADREHYGRWLHAARQAVRNPELLPLWTETRGRSEPEKAAEEMLERTLLPEVAVHAVGEPLVALRMLEKGIAQDDLQDRYATLAGIIQRWAADGRREAAALERLQQEGDVRARIEAARAERRLDELPALYGRLAEIRLASMTTWDQAREAAALAGQGAAAAALLGDEATELRLRVLEGKALLEAEDPEAAEKVLAEAARRLEGKREHVLLGLEARGRLGHALVEQEKDEEAEPIFRDVWREADAIGTAGVLEWRVSPRRWLGGSCDDVALLRQAWELARDGPRKLAVHSGAAYLRVLGPNGIELAEAVRARARELPRDPSLVAEAEFMWARARNEKNVSVWTRVIDILSECAPADPYLPYAYGSRAVSRRSLQAQLEDLETSLRIERGLPRRDPWLIAWTTSQLSLHLSHRPENGKVLAQSLVELRALVEAGAARRLATQRPIVAAHLSFAANSPDRRRAEEQAFALEASMRTRPWSSGRAGWRHPLMGVAPMVSEVARRAASEAKEAAAAATRQLYGFS